MSILHVNPGSFHFPYGSFRPKGRAQKVGDWSEKNPAKWDATDTLAARIFVGFNVGGEPTWSIDDLIKIVSALRSDKPNASFIAQKGIYQHKTGGEIVIEDSAQIIIIDTWGTPEKEFVNEMIALCENIAAELEQEEVVLEIQKNGITQRTFGVVP